MKQAPVLMCFSNAFGLGPTGNMQYIAGLIRPMWPGQIHAYVSPLVERSIPPGTFDIVRTIDDRSEPSITAALDDAKDDVVVLSFANRFAIEAAHRKKIRCLIFDSLGWMWPEIPVFYRKADAYLTYNMPGTAAAIHKLGPEFVGKAHVLPFIKQEKQPSPSQARQKNRILIYVGGLQNPFKNDNLIASYACMISSLLESLPKESLPVVTSDPAIITILKGASSTSGASFKSLDRESFSAEMASCELLLTTAGMNTTKEALLLSTPFAYLPAANWSQHVQQRFFMSKKICDGIQWSDFIQMDNGKIAAFSEKEAISTLSKTIESLVHEKESFGSIPSHIARILAGISMHQHAQTELLDKIGVADEKACTDQILSIIKET